MSIRLHPPSALIPTHVLSHGRVPVVLDGIVRAAVEKLGDFRPPIPRAALRVVDHVLLFPCPRVPLEGWIEMVQPPRDRVEIGRRQGPGTSLKPQTVSR